MKKMFFHKSEKKVGGSLVFEFGWVGGCDERLQDPRPLCHTQVEGWLRSTCANNQSTSLNPTDLRVNFFFNYYSTILKPR